MGRGDALLLLKAASGIGVVLAVVVLIGQHVEPHGSAGLWWNAHWQFIRHCLLSRKNASTEIQAVGSLIAAYGLLRAYCRAKYKRSVSERIVDWIKATWRRLLRLTQSIVFSSIPSGVKFGRIGATQTPPPHKVDITQSLHEQIKQLAQYVNERTAEASKMAIDLTGLKLAIAGLQDAMTELESRMREHTETQIQSFNKQLDSIQALDLGWAIGGLVISFVGTLWGFGA